MKRAPVARPSLRRALWVSAATLGLSVFAGCGEPFAGPDAQAGYASLRISMSLNGMPVAALTVEVTAADISDLLVFNIPVVNNVGSGTISVPAGSDRTIRVRAFNGDAIETHRGETTIDVVEGTNPAVAILLLPIQGDVPITVTLGSLTVEIIPAGVALRVTAEEQIVARVLGPDGLEITRDVIWASANPVIASINEDGLLTGGRAGTTEIFASYGGFGASAHVQVTPFVWASVVAGERHACGLGEDGRAYCWGANDIGQLGDGNASNFNPEPVAVVGNLEFESISPGGLQTCGVLTNGQGRCWGRYIALGNGTWVTSLTPVTVAGGHTWEMIDMGIFHACGVATGGAAYCWGWGNSGRLGTGSAADQNVPTTVQGGHTFVQVSAGQDHSCGVTDDGDAYCWGYGAFGQLGNGLTASSAVPVAVEGDDHFVSVSTGGYHTCGLTDDGRALCWGLADQGQLGGGSTSSSLVPRLVSDLLTFASADAGARHSCGIATDHKTYCWGYGSGGQLGNGQLPAVQATPVRVLSGLWFDGVSAAGSPWSFSGSWERGFSCGLTNHGLAYCWGDNSWGELGDGTGMRRNVPVAVLDP
jgi:alpha-tubulin suppressor-like RCC1 family protein